MKHTFRFLGTCEQTSTHKQEWVISGDEHHHLKKVLKLSVGDAVEVFDGKGSSASGELSFLDNKKALVSATPLEKKEGKSHYSIAIGALKPGFIDDLLPSLTELGVDGVHIFLSAQVEKSRISEKAINRWHKIILASVKQCKRNYLPEIKTWPDLQCMLDAFENQGTECIVLDASGTEPFLNHVSREAKHSMCAVVGGEKGFSEQELAMFSSRKLQCQKLGAHILRAYTAAIATASILSRHSC